MPDRRLIAVVVALAAVLLAFAAPARRMAHHWFPGVDHANLPPDETLREVADLPVVAFAPHGGKPRAAAILITGGGGWADIDRGLAKSLAADGVATIGLDSLRYFLRPRSPEQVGADVGRMIEAARRVWGVDEVMLVGFSFGADTVPVAYNRLPPADRASVGAVAMLAASKTADLGLGVAKLLGRIEGFRTPTRPEVLRLSADGRRPRVICIYGDEPHEVERSICPSLDPARVDVIELPGGHHFDGDYQALGHRLAGALPAGPG